MINSSVPILGFVARSGTGKTTLLKQVIPLLKQQGLRVGLIKRSHHNFEIDHPGKDSHTLRMAGASPVMLTSSHRRAVITEHAEPREFSLDEELAHFDQSAVDLILVEGFKHEIMPKIEICRPSLNNPPIFPDDPSIIAIATDAQIQAPPELRTLDLNAPAQIAEFIRRHFFPNGIRRPLR